MKLRTAPLDDVHQELQFTFSDRTDLIARCLLWAANFAYRCHRRALLAAFRLERLPRVGRS